MIRMIITVLKSAGIISSCSHTAAAQNIHRHMQQTPTLHSRLSAPASNSTLNALKVQAGIQIKVFEKDKKREREKKISLASFCPPLLSFLSEDPLMVVLFAFQCGVSASLTEGIFSLLNK